MLIYLLGIGDCDCKGINCFVYVEMFKCIIVGYFIWLFKMQVLVKNNMIEVYCFFGGVIQVLLWEIGVGCLGFFIYVGLGLFVDLCNGGGKLNECIIDDLVELIEIDGEIKFCYCSFKVDYVILCGIYVDF